MSNEIDNLITEAIHDVCEECDCRRFCKAPCYEVVRMRKLGVDVSIKQQQEDIKSAINYLNKERLITKSEFIQLLIVKGGEG